MNDDELKSLWQRQELAAPSQLPDNEMVKRMKTKMKKFDRTLFWRDAREMVACVFVIYAYHGMLKGCHSLLSQAGCWVVMLSAVFIAFEMIYTRHKEKPSVPGASVREYIEAEVRKVGWQIRLLKSVLWWYILPIFVGAEMYVLGQRDAVADKVIVTVVFIFVGTLVWWINQYAVKKTLRPLQAELEQALAELT